MLCCAVCCCVRCVACDDVKGDGRPPRSCLGAARMKQEGRKAAAAGFRQVQSWHAGMAKSHPALPPPARGYIPTRRDRTQAERRQDEAGKQPAVMEPRIPAAQRAGQQSQSSPAVRCRRQCRSAARRAARCAMPAVGSRGIASLTTVSSRFCQVPSIGQRRTQACFSKCSPGRAGKRSSAASAGPLEPHIVIAPEVPGCRRGPVASVKGEWGRGRRGIAHTETRPQPQPRVQSACLPALPASHPVSLSLSLSLALAGRCSPDAGPVLT